MQDDGVAAGNMKSQQKEFLDDLVEKMKKGDVWIVEIPMLDGHEQHGVRPVIVIADTKTSVAIVIPCTSNLRALRFPHTLQLEPTQKNGLSEPTVALLFQLRAIDKKRFQKKIGALDKQTMSSVNKMLRSLLAL